MRRVPVIVLCGLVASIAALAAAPLLMPSGYSAMSNTISESAAQNLAGAWLARLGFLLFGLSVLGVVSLRAASWGAVGTGMHWAFGAFMVAVAAFSHRNPFGMPSDGTEDLLHSVAATAMGFAFAFGIIAVQVHARRLGGSPSWIYDAFAVAASVLIPLTMIGSPGIAGLVQRGMFAVSYVWYARQALRV
jgi:hypothetical protein